VSPGVRAISGGAGALVCTLWLAGCAVQLGGGAQVPFNGTPVVPAMQASARIHHPRAHGGYAAGSVLLSDPDRGGLLSVQTVFAEGGYRWLYRGFTFELGAEVGFGQPGYASRNGTGLYLGATSAALVRLFGHQDTSPGFAPGAAVFDLFVTPRLGLWTPSVSDASVAPEGSFALIAGIRVSIVSDLAVVDNPDVEP
jgi:hypothetical protein